MRLTKKKAIELSVELWTWLAETGKGKEDWPSWNPSVEIAHFCFLCEYVEADGCGTCPYHLKFRWCLENAAPYCLWAWAGTDEERKKYARLFLEQLQSL